MYGSVDGVMASLSSWIPAVAQVVMSKDNAVEMRHRILLRVRVEAQRGNDRSHDRKKAETGVTVSLMCSVL